MGKDDVRWAVVGLGMGRARAKLIKETPGARLSAVCDINEDLTRKFSEELDCRGYTSLDDLLKDDEVEVVFTLSPSGLHAEQCIAALEAGKHAVTTKPMDVSSEKCRKAIEAAKKAGKLLAVDFNARYDERHLLIRAAIDKGLLGKLILGEARLKWYRSQKYYDDGGWRGTWGMDGGGSLANQTVHQIDLMLWYMGEPARVRGHYGVFAHKIETEDLGMAMVEFKNGAVGMVLGTTTFPKNAYCGVEVHGDRGGVVATEETKWYFLDPEDEKKVSHDYPYKNIVQDVNSAVRKGTAPLCDGEQGLRSVAFLEALYRSSREGKAVEL